MATSNGDRAGHERLIRSAFDNDAALGDRVLQSAQQNRDQWQLLVDVALYIQKHMSVDSQPSKKRKVSPSDDDIRPSARDTVFTGETIFSPGDTSFSIPVRKKLCMRVLAKDPSGGPGGLTIALPDDSTTPFAIPWHQIAFAFSLPVPEKASRATYFALFLSEPGSSSSHPALGDSKPERQFLWTMPDRVPGKSASEQDATSMADAMRTDLRAHGKELITPDDDEFVSAVVQSHRKGEKAHHVKAHVGSKDGFLFFLPNGIFYGFRKPLLFYPFADVESISYTSVLQRTFNLVIKTSSLDDVEFSMLDQADFAGIDMYIKRHGLNDASMAAERRAQRYNVNDKKVEGVNGDGDGVETHDAESEETELQKAERELREQQQDDDDEEGEGEDYDPGSEGESEGEGGSSDEEDDGDGKGVEHDGQDDEQDDEL